jgi:hypothetical protein
MYFIQTSKDLLYVALSFCVLWLTIFTAWLIYYLIMIFRQLYFSVREMRQRFNKVDEAIRAFKEKIEHSASYLLLIGEGIKKLVETAKEYSGKKAPKKKK